MQKSIIQTLTDLAIGVRNGRIIEIAIEQHRVRTGINGLSDHLHLLGTQLIAVAKFARHLAGSKLGYRCFQSGL